MDGGVIMDKTLIVVYIIAALAAALAYGNWGDGLRALNAGLAALGAVITVWLIADEIKSRIEGYYEKRFTPKKDDK